MIVNHNTVMQSIAAHNGEFAEVRNPGYIYPPVEYYTLAPKIFRLKGLSAAMMDMDGTTTTTEVLCIHSLEYMVRRMSGLMDKSQWEGIDHHADLPFIIGNSTTRHVEYLLNKYQPLIDPAWVAKSFAEAAWWTLRHGRDAQRKSEVIQNLRKTGLGDLINAIAVADVPSDLSAKLLPLLQQGDFTLLVSLGIDIYYETYHRILALLSSGNSAEVKRMVFGHAHAGGHLISPMPGITFLLPLLKGWLGHEAHLLADVLFDDYRKSTDKEVSENQKDLFVERIKSLGAYFAAQPAKLGLVTSSIFYEADIVIREVMQVLAETISQSALSAERKAFICRACDDYHNWYDAFVTASDSNEIRLKPHRDLYSIALHKAGLLPSDFDNVVGFEDSQSGTVAIRAAGIGCCVAVPFAQTKGHNFEAATHIAIGGIPQVILEHNLFLDL
ncbi:MAG: HAD family phosphatase [Bacteroidetes bacterium]|nr:HAD family phosphatase [Bacteroidota bacterium]